MTYLGWYDANKKKHVRAKLAEAIARYQEKFGRYPRICLTSRQDALDLVEPSRKYELPGIIIQERPYIARFTFYIGEDAGEPA